MSRLARQPITKKTEISVAETGGIVTVKGPKGELHLDLLPGTMVAVEGDAVWVKTEEGKEITPNLGTMWSNLQNAIIGVTEGFSKILEIEGVGYKAQMEGKNLALSLGFSHPIRFELPEGLTASVEKNTITISGIDKQKVGQAAAEIRSYRKPEPYKGKGIRYRGEVVRRKVGKKAATA
jgi:large subunit ribosomal protein L6